MKIEKNFVSSQEYLSTLFVVQVYYSKTEYLNFLTHETINSFKNKSCFKVIILKLIKYDHSKLLKIFLSLSK